MWRRGRRLRIDIEPMHLELVWLDAAFDGISPSQIYRTYDETLRGIQSGDYRFITLLDRRPIAPENYELLRTELGRTLRTNNVVVQLSIQSPVLSDSGATHLARALVYNCCLEFLLLYDCGITAAGAKNIAQSLEINMTLKACKLIQNAIKDEGAQAFARTLWKNYCLEVLSLDTCEITSKGAKDLAQSLKLNMRLENLILCRNFIQDEGAIDFSRALEKNFALRDLDLSYNSISKQGGMELNRLLRKNPNIEGIRLEGNALCEKEGSKLNYALSGRKRNREKFELELRTVLGQFLRSYGFEEAIKAYGFDNLHDIIHNSWMHAQVNLKNIVTTNVNVAGSLQHIDYLRYLTCLRKESHNYTL